MNIKTLMLGLIVLSLVAAAPAVSAEGHGDEECDKDFYAEKVDTPVADVEELCFDYPGPLAELLEN